MKVLNRERKQGKLNFLTMNIDKNEIKKALYRQKPTAYLMGPMIEGFVKYEALVTVGGVEKKVCFTIHETDIPDSGFSEKMEAQLLIRWMQ